MQKFGGLLRGEAKEEAQFDHAALFGIDPFQFLEDAIQINHLGVASVDPCEFLMQRDEHTSVALLASLGARVIDEHSPHQARGEAVEVLAILKPQAALANEL